VPTVLSGALGSLAGAWLWYFAAVRFRRRRVYRLIERHGRWLTLTTADLERAEGWFTRHGRMAVLVGRLLPGVRTLISVPAGLTGMGLATFLALTTIGTLAWVVVLTLAGMLLGSQYEAVAHWLNPVSNVLFIGLAALYGYRLLTRKGRSGQGRDRSGARSD
jgi:membrane protein DedA with SNARE-associated domain